MGVGQETCETEGSNDTPFRTVAKAYFLWRHFSHVSLLARSK